MQSQNNGLKANLSSAFHLKFQELDLGFEALTKIATQ